MHKTTTTIAHKRTENSHRPPIRHRNQNHALQKKHKTRHIFQNHCRIVESVVELFIENCRFLLCPSMSSTVSFDLMASFRPQIDDRIVNLEHRLWTIVQAVDNIQQLVEHCGRSVVCLWSCSWTLMRFCGRFCGRVCG